jgi:prolyl 3-hydroxylase /prolyl 3,4-dihydroxylase
MRSLQTVLFPNPAFRAWLAAVTSLIPMKFELEARRFRPGLDYTLAMSEEKDARLDVCLGLTPTPPNHKNGHGRGRGKEGENLHYYHLSEGSWESGEWGGWEVSSISFSPRSLNVIN